MRLYYTLQAYAAGILIVMMLTDLIGDVLQFAVRLALQWK